MIQHSIATVRRPITTTNAKIPIKLNYQILQMYINFLPPAAAPATTGKETVPRLSLVGVIPKEGVVVTALVDVMVVETVTYDELINTVVVVTIKPGNNESESNDK